MAEIPTTMVDLIRTEMARISNLLPDDERDGERLSGHLDGLNFALGLLATTSDADLLAMASAFDLIPFNPSGDWRSIRELRVERRRINPEAWSIGSEGKVLLRDGMWVLEPRPSERDDEFLSEARWPTARDAISFAREHMVQNPSGYTQEYRDLCWAPRSAETHG